MTRVIEIVDNLLIYIIKIKLHVLEALRVLGVATVNYVTLSLNSAPLDPQVYRCGATRMTWM